MLFKICNALMGLRFNMLGANESSSTGEKDASGIIQDAGSKVYSIVVNIIGWILTFAGVGIAIYAIYLAIVFFRADSAEKREEAKKRLIYAVIGVVAAIALVLIVKFVIGAIPGWLGYNKATPTTRIGL